MGFGHRVYKNYDPRARIVKEQADKILGKLGGDDELLDIAKALEEVALTDDYFVERKLYPNVDFYTGVIYRAMGFPTRCSPCCSRSAGCPAGSRTGARCTTSGGGKIGRPRQIYTGYTERDYAARQPLAFCDVAAAPVAKRSFATRSARRSTHRACFADSCSFTIVV